MIMTKYNMIISIDSDKAFEKIQHPFIIKPLGKLKVDGNFLNLIKNFYKKPTANITVNGEKLYAFPLRLGTTCGCSLLPIQHFTGCPS